MPEGIILIDAQRSGNANGQGALSKGIPVPAEKKFVLFSEQIGSLSQAGSRVGINLFTVVS